MEKRLFLCVGDFKKQPQNAIIFSTSLATRLSQGSLFQLSIGTYSRAQRGFFSPNVSLSFTGFNESAARETL